MEANIKLFNSLAKLIKTRDGDDVTVMLQTLLSADKSQQQQLLFMINNIKINHTNKTKTGNFAQDILDTSNTKTNRYVHFLESKSINALIHAPTQVGKSDATREFIETCFRNGVPAIVSTDNKTDQQEQLYSRLDRDLSGADVRLLKVTDKSFGEDLKECVITKHHRFVVFCLDNSSQIEKLIVNLTSIGLRYKANIKSFKKLAIIHDEADQITKDHDIDAIQDKQAASHKKWIELISLINTNMSFIDLKRVFVTATPENVLMLYHIDCPHVMRLEIPSTYQGYKDIEYISLEDDLDITRILKKEVSRIKAAKTCEAILYCIDRKIIDGHDKLLIDMSGYLDCIINTYNGKGIEAYLRNKDLANSFEIELGNDKYTYTRNKEFFSIVNMTIRRFYTICKRVGEKCIVTIGKDLISRGISYVSEDTFEPITATTMIFKPGMSLHSVGICQVVGRITGCAMPSLKRRLYAPKDVIDTYNTYNINQEAYITEMEKDAEAKSTKDVIDGMVFEKTKRRIDRPKLKLKIRMVKNKGQTEVAYEKMKKLIDLWWNGKTIISKILHFVYDNESVNEMNLKAFISNSGSTNVKAHYDELIKPDRMHNLVFTRSSKKITTLTQQARDYIISKL